MQNRLKQITNPLVKWYQTNKRDLPWRNDKDPYHVWISEIMLQQTRIEAVKSYYQRFMKALPNVERLSNIPEEELLKLWEGLGYYSRAKNLKKAAEIIVKEYDGEMPTSYEELVRLPGIGEYTAGAISSICYNEKVTAVDGNVLRVISRITGSYKNVLLPETKKEVEKALKEILPKQSGDFNEGLMELGEIICLPNGIPCCKNCPIHPYCIAYEKELTQELPVRVKTLKRKEEEKTVLLLVTPNHKVAVEKREGKGLLGGMYQFPNCEGFLTEKEIKNTIRKWNLKTEKIELLLEQKHVFTHIDWKMKGYIVNVKSENSNFTWATVQDFQKQYPLPTAFQKFLKIYKERGT